MSAVDMMSAMDSYGLSEVEEDSSWSEVVEAIQGMFYFLSARIIFSVLVYDIIILLDESFDIITFAEFGKIYPSTPALVQTAHTRGAIIKYKGCLSL